MFLKISVLAAVMLFGLFCHSGEAAQCTVTSNNVRRNITCDSGCCLGGSGLMCCGDTTIKPNDQQITRTQVYYSGVASLDMNTFQLIVFACLAMLVAPRVQW